MVLSQLLIVLFLMILTKALLQLPLFYLDPLLVVVALTFAEATRRRLIWPRKRVQAVAQFWLLLDKCKGLVTLSWFLLFFDILVCFNPITIRYAQGRNPA